MIVVIYSNVIICAYQPAPKHQRFHLVDGGSLHTLNTHNHTLALAKQWKQMADCSGTYPTGAKSEDLELHIPQ